MKVGRTLLIWLKTHRIGDLRKLSREELELYDEDIKNMRDIYATRKFEQVSTVTELPLKEIQKLKEQNSFTN